MDLYKCFYTLIIKNICLTLRAYAHLWFYTFNVNTKLTLELAFFEKIIQVCGHCIKCGNILLAEFYWYDHGTVILIYSNNSKNSNIKTETETDNES